MNYPSVTMQLLAKLVIVCVLFFLAITPARAGEIKALLIGLQHYDHKPLAFIAEDISQLGFVLMDRYSCEASGVADTAAEPGDARPARHRQSILDKISRWSKRFKTDDTAILYLGGHGVRDSAGRLYLAMINFDGKNVDEAAIPMQAIRDLIAACPAKCKLLILDTCYAGTAKGDGFDAPTAQEMSKAFDDLEDLSTIASSRGDQQSWLWEGKRHSLFTYWLIEALKGNADRNGDREIKLAELSSYLTENVSWIAETVLGQKQTPVILHPERNADVFRLPLKPVPLEQLIDDMAEQIDVQMRAEDFNVIGIPEFATGTKAEASIDPRYGSLPRWVANELAGRLSKRRRGAYRVLSEQATRQLLVERGITPSELGTQKAKDLTVGGQTVPVLLAGRVNLFGIANISLRASLLETDWNSEVGQSGGLAMISKTILAMTEINAILPDRRASPLPEVPDSPPALAQRLERDVAELRDQECRQDMLGAGQGSFDVHFRICRPTGSDSTLADSDYTIVRRPEFLDGMYYLPVSFGERYAIVVHSRTGTPVFAKVLVDGLNTLSQKQVTSDKGIEVVAREQPDWQLAPCVDLDSARAWYLEKATPYGVYGFYDDKGTSEVGDDTLNRFRIEDADQAVAVRRGYTKQIGLITVAFFDSRPNGTAGRGNDGQPATAMDPAERVQLEHYKGNNVPGNLLAVFTIRYLTPDTLADIRRRHTQSSPQ